MAFKIINKHFHEQLEQTSADQKVVMVIIKEASNVPYTDSISCTTDPFCRVNIQQPVLDFDQLQRTSQLCHTVNPVWSDDSRFFFIVEDDSKLIFNITRHLGMNAKVANMLGMRKFLGDAIIKVSAFSSEMTEYVLPLIDPVSGGGEGKLTIEGAFVTKEEAQHTRYDVCFQYQRFNIKWDDDNLLPTDPGRFSSAGNTCYGDSFESVTEAVPEGWVVEDQWSTLAADDLGQGWLYAIDFGSSNWYTHGSATVFVRRRAWTRRVAAKVASVAGVGTDIAQKEI